MTKTVNSTKKQLKFMILLTLLDNDDYAKTGINVNNLQASLLDNKEVWYKVGKVSDKKLWSVRLSGELSDLDKKEHALRKTLSNKYFKGNRFDEVMRQLVSELTEFLELDIELSHDMFNGDLDTEEIVNGIGEGSIEYSILSMDDETKKHFLTTEQATRLAQLSVQYGHTEF